MSARRLGTLLIAAALCGCATESVPPPSESTEDGVPLWKQYLEQRIERIRSGEVTPMLLHVQQARSVEHALFAPPVTGGECAQAVAVSLPGEEEVAHFLAQRERFPSEGFEYLDEFFLERDDLKALAVRDSDSDGIADYLVSDYFGKFMEGDIDIDADGVRNTLDACPYDAERGGSGTGGDANSNGVPDHVDLAFRHESGELSEIQSGLFRDHGILLVERNAAFDVPLARAVDDTVRRVFRAYFDASPVMPTLRTLAVEHTALIGPLAKAYVDDHTSAQTFSHTQSLTVYDEGRAVEHEIGLLGLIVHEMGHSYHMALDFDADDPAAENARRDFPAPNFVALIEPFGWIPVGYYDGRFNDSTDVPPRFAYVDGAEPVFEYRGRSPEAWGTWLLEQYDALDQDPEYLKDSVFADQQVVGDYALTSPYEWFGDHFIAYVITVLERHVVDKLEASGRADAVEPALAAIEDAMHGIWPDFYHRNIAPEVLAYFEQTFPITMDDRETLARRYIDPIIEPELGL